MKSRDFCYWLQGFFELTEGNAVTEVQIATVKKHLALVFAHEIDPAMGSPAHQSKLDEVHKGPSVSPSGTMLFRC